MKRGLFYIFLIPASLLFYTGSAQDYVITVKGDTLKGDVRPLSYGAEKKVQLTEPGKKKVIYPFYQVKAFSHKGEVFQPAKGPNGYTFMKVIKSGYLSLLYFQSENQVTYDGSFLLKRDGSATEVPNLSFEKVMKKFLGDCPMVADKIERDELNKKDINKIVDEYNACIENRSERNEKVLASKTEQVKETNAWDLLEEKVKKQPAFEGQDNALEMIGEIKSKITSAQKIPNFLLDGLKSTLNQDIFKAELENALKEVN